MNKPEISVVVPVFNENEVIAKSLAQLTSVLETMGVALLRGRVAECFHASVD